MSSHNEHISMTIKKNCIKCNIFFKNLCNNINCCFPIINKKDDSEKLKLSNTAFNKKRTSSMNDYIVNSYINDKSENTDLEVPTPDEIMDRV